MLENGSLIFLVVLFAVSVSLSASVLLFLISIGIHSGAGKLTFFLNLSFLMVTVSKFPIYLVRVPFACAVAGYVYWYFSALGLLVLYDLVGAVNLRMLVKDQTSRTISRASEYNLQDSSALRLFIFPLISLIVPLCSGSFVRSEKYCEIDRDSRIGIYSRSAYLVFTLLIQIAILRKLYLTCGMLRSSLSENTYRDLFWKLLTGPGAYPIILVLGTIVADIVILVTYLSHLSGSESDYCLEILQAVLGIFAVIIFYLFERRDIQVTCLLSLSIASLLCSFCRLLNSTSERCETSRGCWREVSWRRKSCRRCIPFPLDHPPPQLQRQETTQGIGSRSCRQRSRLCLTNLNRTDECLPPQTWLVKVPPGGKSDCSSRADLSEEAPTLRGGSYEPPLRSCTVLIVSIFN
jgi:hypothetical protein